MKKIYLLLAIFSIISLSAFGAYAADFRFVEKGGNVSVSQDEQVKNLYTAGNMISIDADIEKSLYVAGNVITINSNVENNIFAAGNTVVIKGSAGDSVHIGAGNVIIDVKIEEDLIIGGGNITISKDSLIKGDLIIGGGTIDFQGLVNGDVRLGGGQATINGKVNGQIDAKVDELIFGDNAEIAGKVVYSSPKEATISEEANLAGGIEFNEIEIRKVDKSKVWSFILVIFSLGFLIKILSAIAVGLVLIYMFRDRIEKLIKQGFSHFWANFGKGFAALILTPIACVILLVTVVGAWLAGLLGMIYAFGLILSFSLAGIIFGSWLIKVLKKKSEYPINWQAVVLGVIILQLIVLIPFVGWIVKLVFVLVGLGSISSLAYKAVVQK